MTSTISSDLTDRILRLCSLSGYAFVAVFIIAGALVAGFVPPINPSWGAEEVSALFAENATRISFGMLLLMLGMGLLVPFWCVLSIQMARIEGRLPILSVINLLGSAVGTVYFVLPVLIWASAAFRGDHDPGAVLLLNDLGWIILVWPFSIPLVQNVAITICFLADKHPEPLFPRWVAWFTIWTALLIAPGALIIFFKTGPFAWNGLLAFYMVAGVYMTWLLIMSWALHRSVGIAARRS